MILPSPADDEKQTTSLSLCSLRSFVVNPPPADDESHLSYDLSSIAHRATEEALAK